VLRALLIAAASLLLAGSIWIVIPAPAYALLPVGVVAPEVSPLLLVAALIVGACALRAGGAARSVVLVLSVATAAVASRPLLQWQTTHARFDAATQAWPAATTGRETDSISITRGIAFAEPGGSALTLDLYRPDVNRPLPIVMQLYGGAWQRGAPGDNASFATALARRGYLVIAIDYRHAPRWPWPAQIDDVRAAVEWVIMHAGDYGGDPRLIALVGRSSGAQLALVEAYTDPARFSAVVSLYGPTDLAAGWRTPPSPDPLPVRPVLEAFLGGTPDTVPQRYAAASPITYVSKKAPPTLLIYGARDHIVEPRFGRDLDARLHAAGASSVYLEVPWAEHAFDAVPGLGTRAVQPYIERFLAANLQ
jgi:acetyl esterase/lipase